MGGCDGTAVGTDVGIPVGTADGRAMNVGCAVCGYVGTFPIIVGGGTGTDEVDNPPVDGGPVEVGKLVGIRESVDVGVSVGAADGDCVGSTDCARVVVALPTHITILRIGQSRNGSMV